MAWVRLDDDTPDHPKYLSFGDLAPLALALQVRALCYANHYLTDGHIPVGALPKLLDGFSPCDPATGEVLDWPRRMVEAGIWERNGRAGFVIHDYATYQRSKAQVEADRQTRRAIAQAGGRARAAQAQRAAGRFQPADQQATSSPAGERLAHVSAAHQPRPGPVPVPKDKDVPPTSRRAHASPTHVSEIVNGRRLRLQVNSPEPDPPTPPDQPGPTVPW